VADNERRLLGIFTGRDAVCRVLAKSLDPANLGASDLDQCFCAAIRRC